MASAASLASVARCSILWLRLHEYHPLPPSLLHFARNPSLSILPRFRPNVLLLLAPLLLLLLLSSFSICHEFAIRSSPSILRSWLNASILVANANRSCCYCSYYHLHHPSTTIIRALRASTNVCVHANSARVCVNTRVLLLLHLFLRMYT